MADSNFYKVKWETVEGEAQSKRFESKAEPELEMETFSERDSPRVLRVTADGNLVVDVLARRFIHLESEDA